MLFRTLLLLLILVIFGFGFTMQVLWYVAAVLLAVWLIAFVMRGRSGGLSRFSRSRG
ncbi:hydrophobic protein [Streptomyces sp. NBC_01283]|uniref:hydrophobic protein n=1 Tax=Streptomyces sp. NBC_01283 TaxID=2903812 RepID=UPI00352BFB34|nr:hydrophobic protein [Streptomyces sp. NBC_01283]